MKITIWRLGFTLFVGCILAWADAVRAAAPATLKSAVITQKVNKVTLAQSSSTTPQPAKTGAVVSDENVVRTGVQSRAELEFADKTLTRLGANAIFSFDVKGHALEFQGGSGLFSKPKGTGPLEIRSAAVTAAITGSTGFVSVLPTVGKKPGGPNAPAGTVLMGMVEGSLKGKAVWFDDKGRRQTFRFKLGPGDMLVSEPGKRPVIVQFDLPRFVSTSPLVKGFASTLPNGAQIAREVAAFQTLTRRGFIDSGNVMIANVGNRLVFVGTSQPVSTRFDAGINQLSANNNARNQPTMRAGGTPVFLASLPPGAGQNSGGFVAVGGTGTIRGQLVWQTSADLDLHLLLPNSQEVYYANRTVTFNQAQATARLDADNLGGVINVAPNKRVENIVVNGVPASGNYSFFVRSFSTPNTSDPFTLTVTGNGGVTNQVLNSNLPAGQNSQSLTVRLP